MCTATKKRERDREIGREKTDESKGSVKKQNRNTTAQDCAQKAGIYLAKVEELQHAVILLW